MSSPNVFLYLANSHERLTGGGFTLFLCFSFSFVNIKSDTFPPLKQAKNNLSLLHRL